MKLLAGHTHSFDAPIRKMREIIDGGTIGPLVSVNTWNYNEFNPRPWTTAELRATHGPILNQGPHQVDIVRQLGGGMVRSVRAQTVWDGLRGCEGGWTAFLEFENGVPATLVYDARGFFDTAELFGWVGEGGKPRDPGTNVMIRQNYHKLERCRRSRARGAAREPKGTRTVRCGSTIRRLWELWGYGSAGDEQHQPFFGITIASCERGAMRQSADGLIVYADDGGDARSRSVRSAVRVPPS